MPIINLTQTFIAKHLTCPSDKKRIEYCDQSVAGFYVEVRHTAPGKGGYYLRYKKSGKTAHQRIGTTDTLSLIDARNKAIQLKAEIAAGTDPKQTATDAELSYASFLQQKYLPYAKRHKRSYRFDEGLINNRIIKRFGRYPLTKITRSEVQSFHSELHDQGLSPATCDHHIKLIRRTLNLAVDWGLIDSNPIKRIELFKVDNQLDNLLNDQQLQSLLTVLRSDENRMVCRLALFLLSTGARLGEALKARWMDIDTGNRVWRIPASNSKSKRIRSVPLNASALTVLDELDTHNHTFLFVSSQTGERLKYVHKVWRRLRAQAGLPQLRLHDLRHQYASFLVNNGRSLYEVQQILGHSSPTVTQRYAHLSTRSLQDAAESATSRLLPMATEADLETS